jgi:hypothetical protein
VNACTLSDVDNKVDIGVIVVVGSTGNFNISVGHSNVFGVNSQILGRGHDGELDCALGTESLVGPFSDRSNLLDGGDTVVCNQDLVVNTASQ